MEKYFNIVRDVLNSGTAKSNRTKIPTIAIAGAMFKHDMRHGFPLLTTKKMGIKSISAELEFFIKGITDKRWLQERGCTIWNEWCSPMVVPYGHDEETQRKMFEERELGPIYGWQWRNFGGTYIDYKTKCTNGFDQLAWAVETIKNDPNDRQVIVSSWNPIDKPKMALPPCHWGFQLFMNDGRLCLSWVQRSIDVALGLPYNIASYGLLLLLIAEHIGMEPGTLVGKLSDVHVYTNHISGLKKQLERDPQTLPRIILPGFKNVFDWEYNQVKLINYHSHPAIKFDIAV